MLISIYLDDDAGATTFEIGDVAGNWRLPTKMESQSSQFAQTHPKLDLLMSHGLAKLSGTLVRHQLSFFSLPVLPEGEVGSSRPQRFPCVAPPDLAALGRPPRRRGGNLHFGADIATIMVTTSLPRLMISRSSLGPMKQLSRALSTVSAPPAITVNSPESTT